MVPIPHRVGQSESVPLSDSVAPTSPRRLTVAAVQAEMHFYSRETDFRRQMAACLEQARAYGADLVVFPEDLAAGLVALGAGSTDTGAVG